MKNAFELGYRRSEWKCDVFNQPSRAAAQRLGMSFDGPQPERAYRSWLAPENFDPSGLQRSRLSALTAPLLVRRG